MATNKLIAALEKVEELQNFVEELQKENEELKVELEKERKDSKFAREMWSFTLGRFSKLKDFVKSSTESMKLFVETLEGDKTNEEK